MQEKSKKCSLSAIFELPKCSLSAIFELPKCSLSAIFKWTLRTSHKMDDPKKDFGRFL